MLYLLFIPLIFSILTFRAKRFRSAVRRHHRQSILVELGLISVVTLLSLILLFHKTLMF